MKRRILSIFIAIVMIVSLSATVNADSDAPTIHDALEILKQLAGLPNTAPAKSTIHDALEVLKFLAGLPNSIDKTVLTVKIGEVIKFGGYDWRVLDIQGGRALVISDIIVDSWRPYHNKNIDITWADCDLREYLNGEFYDSFNQKDKAKIVQVTNKTPNNPWYGTSGGADTQDHIFLLSLEEVVKYFGDSGQLANRVGNKDTIEDQFDIVRQAICDYEPCYRSEGKSSGDYGCYWWLRSPGNRVGDVVLVMRDGSIYVNGGGASLDYLGGIRPALWLYL